MVVLFALSVDKEAAGRNRPFHYQNLLWGTSRHDCENKNKQARSGPAEEEREEE